MSFTEGHMKAAQIDQPVSPDQMTQWAEWGSINYNLAKVQGDIDGVQIMQRGLPAQGPWSFEGLWSVWRCHAVAWKVSASNNNVHHGAVYCITFTAAPLTPVYVIYFILWGLIVLCFRPSRSAIAKSHPGLTTDKQQQNAVLWVNTTLFLCYK